MFIFRFLDNLSDISGVIDQNLRNDVIPATYKMARPLLKLS